MGTITRSIKEIKLSYVGCWLRHQLQSPGWFHNFFVSRKAWGAFSIYSHVYRKENTPKKTFSTEEEAQEGAKTLEKRYHNPFVVYKCLFCEGWHVSKIEAPKAGPSPEEIIIRGLSDNLKNPSKGLDVGIITSTGIPDLAYVYGGFRGRTLSATKQHYAWGRIVRGGITQIIDLRGDYHSDFYEELCTKSGISYYHYPVGKNYVAGMVENFHRFCELIDRGCFYIACAHGLHRTDIALCTYWVFYAADRGIAPPPIVGYRKDKGMNTNKLMGVLNAFYQYRTDHEGVEPIPFNVFDERKAIINKLSRDESTDIADKTRLQNNDGEERI